MKDIIRMQQLAGIITEGQAKKGKLLKENINNINDVEKRLEELIREYISDTQDIAGEDLDFGAGEFGYKDDKALFKDFILYILRRYDINLN